MNPILRAFFRLAVCLLLAGVAAQGVELLSVNSSGTNSCNAGVGESFCLSADGRYVAFNSSATNIVVPDTNGLTDVFVRDCVLRSNIWGTVDSRGPVGVNGPTPLLFTPDGRFLLFSSLATNLAPNVTNPVIAQLYRRDLWSNETALVSVAYDGTNASLKTATAGGMTPDGRFILFTTTATNIVAGVNSGTSTFAYLRDMLGGSNELITASPGGLVLDRGIGSCYMSTNARYFAFYVSATNVVPGIANTNGTFQVYWRDRLAGTNTLASVNVDGTFAKDSAVLTGLTRDGRYVSFNCLSTNIVAGQNDNNGTQDIFIRDIVAGETWLVTRATNGNTTGGRVTGGKFSANGEWMMLAPTVADLMPGVQDINSGSPDIYLHHLPTRTNLLVSRSVSGLTGANGYVADGFATLSASGRFVVFDTSSINLLPGAPTAVPRLLLRDCTTSQTLSPLPGAYPTPAYNYGHYVITEDERYVYFLSLGSHDPTVTDANNNADLFRARLLPAQLQAPLPGGLIQGEGIALGTYILQTSSNLTSWFNAVTNIADSNGVFSVSDPQPPGPQRYFRLKTP